MNHQTRMSNICKVNYKLYNNRFVYTFSLFVVPLFYFLKNNWDIKLICLYGLWKIKFTITKKFEVSCFPILGIHSFLFPVLDFLAHFMSVIHPSFFRQFKFHNLFLNLVANLWDFTPTLKSRKWKAIPCEKCEEYKFVII